MKHDDREVRSIEDYFKGLRLTTTDCLVWFRGQRVANWKLLPNIARGTDVKPDGALDQEGAAIKRFMQNAGAFLTKNPEDVWQWIFLMQHHRGLTRMLDWSESPLVGLYFALERGDDTEDAVVWGLDPMKMNEHAGYRRRNPRDVLSFGSDKALDAYLPDRIGVGDDMIYPVAAIGPRNSARMVAQSGTFTIIHREPKPIEEIEDSSHVWRFIIPSDAKDSLRQDLRMIGFNEFMLFPDLERVALHTKELLE